jgi:hypothetical protein
VRDTSSFARSVDERASTRLRLQEDLRHYFRPRLRVGPVFIDSRKPFPNRLFGFGFQLRIRTCWGACHLFRLPQRDRRSSLFLSLKGAKLAVAWFLCAFHTPPSARNDSSRRTILTKREAGTVRLSAEHERYLIYSARGQPCEILLDGVLDGGFRDRFGSLYHEQTAPDPHGSAERAR